MTGKYNLSTIQEISKEEDLEHILNELKGDIDRLSCYSFIPEVDVKVFFKKELGAGLKEIFNERKLVEIYKRLLAHALSISETASITLVTCESSQMPSLDYYDNCRDKTSRYAGKYGKWKNEMTND